jgi:hypothetical protein
MAAEQVTQKSMLFKALVRILTLLGIGGILAGMIHAISIFSSGFTSMRLADAVVNTAAGVLALVCSRVLAKGKSLVILLFGGGVLLSIGYSLAVGRGLNFVAAGVGLLLIAGLIALKRNGEIA